MRDEVDAVAGRCRRLPEDVSEPDDCQPQHRSHLWPLLRRKIVDLVLHLGDLLLQPSYPLIFVAPE
jgi:hypothetical protein